MLVGQIVKAISGFYYVKTADQQIIQCRARGKFKFEKKKQTPLVGDLVEFNQMGVDEGVITFIQPRFSELTRPPIANVDQAIVVCSIKEPDFTQMPLDRFLVHAEHAGLKVIICLTKKDLVQGEHEIKQIQQIYQQTGYPIVITSTLTEEGLDELKKHLHGKVSVFAGQSGVGKSTLLNRLLPDQSLQTGAVSQKIGRGKHTTRQIELLPLDDHTGQVADTPGFSQLNFREMDLDALQYTFPEFREWMAGCRYRGCMHDQESDCNVKTGVEEGKIALTRYQHYLHFLQEVKNQRRY